MHLTSSDSSPATSQALVMRSRACKAAVPLSDVIMTLRPLPVRPVSEAPAFVLGISVILGAPVPVLDLCALLGGEGAQHVTRFVLLTIGGRTVALAVEAVDGAIDLAGLALGELPPLLKGAPSEALSALGVLDHELLLVLNAGRLVPDDVLAALYESPACR